MSTRRPSQPPARTRPFGSRRPARSSRLAVGIVLTVGVLARLAIGAAADVVPFPSVTTTTSTTSTTSTTTTTPPATALTSPTSPAPAAGATEPARAAVSADDRTVAELRRRIEDNGWRSAALGEAYNGVMVRFEAARSRAIWSRVRAEASGRRLDAARTVVRALAAGWYRRIAAPAPGLSVPPMSLDQRRYARYATIADRREDDRLGELRRLQRRLAVDEQHAAKDVQDVEAVRVLLGAALERIKAANARQLAFLTLVEDRRAGAATNAIDPGWVGADLPQVPVSPRVAAVILYARAQLGKPYVFATSGPATFDCSGLTMMAWRQAGVGMAHFSGAQYAAFPKVAVSQLQAGDLVFKGPGGSRHVALYLGGGLQIAATHTGDYVRVQPLMSGISGAVRPG